MGGRMKYIADVLTWTRVVIATVIFGMIWLCPESAGAVFTLFVIGELTDAFDGIFARTWRYTEKEEKTLWWRRHAATIDKVADILLATATMLFVALRVWPLFGWVVGLGLMAIAIPIELWRMARIQTVGSDEKKDPFRTKVVLARRYLYVAVLVLFGVILLLSTEWPEHFKWGLLAAAVTGLVAIAFLKRDRLTEDVTK